MWEQLARATRGLIQEDIIKIVNRYLQDNEHPRPIEHPTNTCDPYTGNWVEHLMNPHYLVETLTMNGFDAQVLPLYWHEASGTLVGKRGKKLLNLGIRLLNAPLYFSSEYAIYAEYGASSRVADQIHKEHIYRCHRSHLWWYLSVLLWELLLHSHALYNRIAQAKQ